MIRIDRFDHIVLTVASIERSSDFYARVLGMRIVTSGQPPRTALAFGAQKINLHEAGHEFEPHAHRPAPGSADICLITPGGLDAVAAHLEYCGVSILEGPVQRMGAMGVMRSIYFRDPDLNLIEVSRYETEAGGPFP